MLARRQLGDGTTTLPKRLEANVGPFLVVVEGTNVDGAALPGAADVNFLGVTLEDGISGEIRNIAIDGGIVPVTASAAIARGAWVSVANTSGQIKTAAPTTGGNTYVLGKAMDAATAAGDVIGVLLVPGLMQG